MDVLNVFVTSCFSYTSCVSSYALRCVSTCASSINLNMTQSIHSNLCAGKQGGTKGLLHIWSVDGSAQTWDGTVGCI